ncbi:ABC transporter substrate-binding protein [Sinirhodobacter populi]|uniref:ABC transporter substrate-binding protein n=1 Tax=Paenirhodobacter populi TaxID=2306993 RepID=A0A443K6M2_9RHOB|nr:ABC transporter substrate-binding protein [Sinirhodobacter populi]RWR28418.1 ABC transporter substrate-binding protein [Sinirhodobacter populi]
MSLLRRILFALLAAVSAAEVGAQPFRIIVTEADTPLVPNSLLSLAVQEGYFRRAGVEVELIRVQQTPMAVAALQSGQGEMANISLESLLMLHREGAKDIVAVHSSDKALPYVIAACKGITLADLPGRRFGIGRPNSLDHMLSSAVLASKGVDVGELDMVPLGQPEVRAQALLAGRIDATTLSIGTYLSLPDHDRAEVLIDVLDYFAAAPVVSKVDVVRAETLRDQSDDLDRVLTALTLAARAFAETPEAWIAAMRRARPDVSPEALAQLSRLYAASWTVNGGFQRRELAFAEDWFNVGIKRGSVNLVHIGQWADFGPMDRVLAGIGIADGADAVSR